MILVIDLALVILDGFSALYPAKSGPLRQACCNPRFPAVSPVVRRAKLAWRVCECRCSSKRVPQKAGGRVCVNALPNPHPRRPFLTGLTRVFLCAGWYTEGAGGSAASALLCPPHCRQCLPPAVFFALGVGGTRKSRTADALPENLPRAFFSVQRVFTPSPRPGSNFSESLRLKKFVF